MNATVLELPYSSKPKAVEVVEIGNEEIGVLQMKKLGGLSLNEHQFVQQHTEHLPNIQVEAVRIATRIHEDSLIDDSDISVSLLTAYNALMKGKAGDIPNNLEDLLNFQETIAKVGIERQRVLATAVIAFRLVPGWTLEHTGDAELIHPVLSNLVAEFAANEESGWPKPKEAQPAVEGEAEVIDAEIVEPEITEEGLGKSLSEEV